MDYSFTIIITQSSSSIGNTLNSILFSSKYSHNQTIFSLNLITSSIIIIQFCFNFGRDNSRKSLLLLIIQSIKIKSKLSFSSFGISSNAFHKISEIVFSNQTSLMFSSASWWDLGEKSILNNFHHIFSSSIQKLIQLNQFAVQISSIFLVLLILIKSTKNFAFTSLIFGTVFLIP
jgi:hypothetical protein